MTGAPMAFNASMMVFAPTTTDPDQEARSRSVMNWMSKAGLTHGLFDSSSLVVHPRDEGTLIVRVNGMLGVLTTYTDIPPPGMTLPAWSGERYMRTGNGQTELRK